MKRNDGELPVPLEGLAEERITRARAIKLAGAMVGTGAFALLLPDEADALSRRQRRRRRRRRRRQRDVAAAPNPVVITSPGVATPVTVTNNGPDTVTIDPRLVDAEGITIDLSGLDLELSPGESVDIPVIVNDPLALVDGRGLLEIRDASDAGIFENLLLETVTLNATDLL